MQESKTSNWRDLTGYHWFVFIVASLAWLFDCLDQQLFILARDNAVTSLLPEGTDINEIRTKGAYAQSIFVAGWALGGLLFGAIGDQIGRAKTLAVTVLIYSLCTGLSSFAGSYMTFCVYRALTGLGVGGVFGLAVALVADSLPEGIRPKALGLLQSLSAVGNITAGLCAMALSSVDPKHSWQYLFWIGSAPAFLCIFIMIRLKEPQKWLDARATSQTDSTKKMGSYRSLLGDPKWSKSAWLGMLLCICGVVGLWGVGFFSNQLVAPAIAASLKDQGLSPQEVVQAKQWWSAANLIVQNIGAFFGMMFLAKLAQIIGRKKAFAVGFIGAFIATVFFYQKFQVRSDIWMSAVMGFFQLSLFAGFAIYLPELFPTRLRSTGTSFCYNVGRFIAASGPFTLGMLQTYLSKQAEAALPPGGNLDEAKLNAFRDAACYISCIFLVGLLILPLLPETKGRPLPED